MGKGEKRINIMRPEVSVVIITYNQENYITNCVDSVIQQQTCRQMEILIGDDASDDGIGDILSKYAKQYPELIRLFRRSRNMGASANLKDLVERASGSYIAFCEGDDFWISDQKLERQIRYLEQHPDCSGCVHDTLLVDQYGNALRNQKLQWVNHKSVFSLDDFSLAEFPGHLSSLMLRNDTKWKSLNKSVLLCDRNKSDRMLFLMVLSMGNIGYIPGRMSAYRFVRSSDGHNLTSAMYNSKQSDCITDMKMCLWMERWLREQRIRPRFLIDAQSQTLITAIFHKLKGYPISLKSVWNLCTHKKSVVCLLPKAFGERLFQKIQIVMGWKVR